MESELAINFANTATVEDLISYLRSTFLSTDFQNVAKTLTLREQDMKQGLNQALSEAEKWKNECLSAEEKHGDLLLKHLNLEEDFNRFKTECEVVKEKFIALTEEKNVLVEKNKGLCSSKRKAEADAEKWEKMYNDVDARVSRLEDEASELFDQNPVIKKELEEIGICTAVKQGGTDPYSVNIACVNGGTPSMDLAGGTENFCKNTDSSLAGGKQSQSQEVIEIDSDNEEPIRFVSTSCNVRASDLKSDEVKMNPELVNIEGSDKIATENAEDSLLASNKRKRADIITCEQKSSDDDNAPSGKRKLKLDNLPQTSPAESRLDTSSVGGGNTPDVSPKSYKPGLGGNNADTVFNPTCKTPGFVRRCTEKSEAKLCSPIHLSDSSDISDSDDGNDGDDYINSMVASVQRRAKPGWVFEADMLQAFETDNELCLNAVCALHRQRSSKSASFGCRGFLLADVLRGTTLAKFLIDGDELGKLKKSVSELQQFDPNGLDDCRKLARRYSKQLFDIYQKREDPFFLPP